MYICIYRLCIYIYIHIYIRLYTYIYIYRDSDLFVFMCAPLFWHIPICSKEEDVFLKLGSPSALVMCAANVEAATVKGLIGASRVYGLAFVLKGGFYRHLPRLFMARTATRLLRHHGEACETLQTLSHRLGVSLRINPTLVVVQQNNSCGRQTRVATELILKIIRKRFKTPY